MSRQKKEVTYTPKTKTRRRRSARRLGKNATLESRVGGNTLRFVAGAAAGKSRSRPKVRFSTAKIAGALVLLAVLAGVYVLFGTDKFYVYGADISGNRVLSADEIYRASGVDSLSIFWVNPRTVQERIEALDYVKSASVSVRLPATVRISVEERLPQVLWRSGDGLWWVDSDGVFLPAKPDATATGIELQIEDIDGLPATQIDPKIIRAALRVYHLKPDINHLYYQREIGLVYTNANGWIIYLGKEDTNIAAKLQVAEAVAKKLLSENITPAFIDVRDPLHVVYNPLTTP